ncbi:hypothetical protein AALP_AA3G270200 [Arabis alpina]|uniref:Uncharacterized protein n=1 Tax=Arabis alpina TaxID=50452 RepID=A0A087HBZ1_ARAAL|nr:hypothetical protein AALP_AA3G270200 [Arabis alpina]
MPASVRPTTVPASAQLTTVPASGRPTTVRSFEPRDTSSAKKTTTTAKGSRLPSMARTEVVAVLPALPAPLPSDYDAKRAAKRKGHEGDDRKRSSNRDDVIDVDRVSKKAREQGGTECRRRLFLSLVNKVGHELEARVEALKEKLDDKTHRTENTHRGRGSSSRAQRGLGSAEALLTEAERSAIALAATKEREQCSAAIVMKRDGELATVVEKQRKADGHIQSLERKFIRAKNKLLMGLLDGQEPPKLEDELAFLTADVAEHAGDKGRFEQLMTSLHGLLHVLDLKVKAPTVVAHDRTLETYAASVGVADPSGSLLGGAGSRKAAVLGVDGKFSLIGGVGAEVTKSRIEDVAKDAGTVEAPEEMRMDEDSQGPMIDALTKDPRLDDVFGETEAEGVSVIQVAPPGVDEETVLLLCFAHLLALLLLMF